MPFQPDFRHFVTVMQNQRPARLTLYEHIFSDRIMEQILKIDFAGLKEGSWIDKEEYFHHYCRFFREMQYDIVPYEFGICGILPGPAAICGGKGPIQSRRDFENYPWKELPQLYWKSAQPLMDALVSALPAGMKAVGGIGYGVFETAEALVGLEYLPFIQADDPALYDSLFTSIGSFMLELWERFTERYGSHFAACRFGDDLGFKSSLLTNPATVRKNVIPQYKRIIDAVHSSGHRFLWHSCGCIFEIMDDVIAAGIDAKHSNEDAIAPFEKWIADYGERIALLGGFDMNFLCTAGESEIYETVLRRGAEYRAMCRGYALGSGNSIPDYMPVENYLAMIRAAQQIQKQRA
ncbi:MAG: hypothetical protein JW957_08470 [Candidatus Omnitrophica bacterium]|nr:hypothetical protein [Candidatus Omnitrophota bacterium]